MTDAIGTLVMRRALRRANLISGVGDLDPPTEDEIRDAIAVLRDASNSVDFPALYLEAERIHDEASK